MQYDIKVSRMCVRQIHNNIWLIATHQSALHLFKSNYRVFGLIRFYLQILKSTPKDYDRYVFNYSLKNQLRYKGNLGKRIVIFLYLWPCVSLLSLT